MVPGIRFVVLIPKWVIQNKVLLRTSTVKMSTLINTLVPLRVQFIACNSIAHKDVAPIMINIKAHWAMGTEITVRRFYFIAGVGTIQNLAYETRRTSIITQDLLRLDCCYVTVDINGKASVGRRELFERCPEQRLVPINRITKSDVTNLKWMNKIVANNGRRMKGTTFRLMWKVNRHYKKLKSVKK